MGTPAPRPSTVAPVPPELVVQPNPAPAPVPAPAHDGPSLPYQRLITFSDAVFAIAATLLVIDLRPPAVSSEAYEAALRDYLSQPGPFVATAIGFLVVGSFWSSHRRIFALLREANGSIVWANLAFLFFVAIQPFLTAALAEHAANTTSVLLYATGQIATCAAEGAMWILARRRPELLTARATPRRIRYVDMQLLRAPATFGLSIPITLVFGPTAGVASWGLLVALAVLISRAFQDLEPRRRAQREQEPGAA